MSLIVPLCLEQKRPSVLTKLLLSNFTPIAQPRG
uniref:Uncharacterized protein n=1 Tax=Manihot esculenta TaxID=3983 RepID=A0A2C9UJJ2_MANES